MMNDEGGDEAVLPLFTARPWAVAGGLGSSEPGRAVKPAVTEGLELFQAAPAAAEAEGYAAWKSEMAAEKAAEEARRRSAELPVRAGEEGFARWKEDAEVARRAFEKRWGVPLGKLVRVQLRGEAREREGLLRVAEEAAEGSSKLLRLTLGGHTFAAAQIESVVRV
ncbi:hypothetical protein [Prosthecobacter sp.]|uniref:hypothetical protein n=1 Tax=Prosthecobacter sp. TaxID=1965333 RepID=UPI0037845EFD